MHSLGHDVRGRGSSQQTLGPDWLLGLETSEACQRPLHVRQLLCVMRQGGGGLHEGYCGTMHGGGAMEAE